MNALRPLSLAVVLACSSVLAVALPKLTFDARVLGEQADVRTWPAEKLPLNVRMPRHVGATLGPRDNTVGGFGVIPVAEVLALNPARDGAVREEIAALRAVLAKRPTSAALNNEFPYFPPRAVPKLLGRAVKYIEFPGGRGVRFLASFSFEVAPVQRGSVYYKFLGLTNDGKYLVAFNHNVNLRELPEDYYATPALQREGEDVFNDVNGAYRKHITKVTRLLDGLTNDPRLTRLDRFVSTIRVR